MSSPKQQGSDGDGMIETLLSMNDVTVSHGETPAIEGVTMSLRRNEIVTVIGPNGAGKSTLIKTALGIIQPDSGNVSRLKKIQIGYVPQSVALDPTLPLSVERFLRLGTTASNERITELLRSVGIENLQHTSMHHISGGEMRRVLLARSLIKKPDLLILDEPTAGVDISGQNEIYALVSSIRDQFQCGILLVSHDLHIVMAATDRVLCINRHLCCSGSPEHVREHPEYLAIFGEQPADRIGIYRHHHDHHHDLHGDVCSHG